MNHKIVGEKHLLPARLAVNLAFALGFSPPPVLIIGLNSKGHCVATAPMDFQQWHFHYVTMRKQ